MLQMNELTNKLLVENLSLIIARELLISFQEEKGDFFDPVRERIRKHKNKIRLAGPDYLAFALLDMVVAKSAIISSGCWVIRLKTWKKE